MIKKNIKIIGFLTILVVPTFSTHPENLTLKSGAIAELVCVADGEPTPSISWYKGERLLATGGRTFVLGILNDFYIAFFVSWMHDFTG